MRCLAICAVLGACGFSIGATGDAGPTSDARDPDAPATSDGATSDAPTADAPPPATIVQTGLIEDLDADLGVTLATNTVNIWANQASGGDDVTVGAGGVTVAPGMVNGHAALRFPGSARLIGDDTAVFCPLTSGAGLTWFAVARPAAQDHVLRNQILGTIREGSPFSGFTAGVNTSSAFPYTMMRPTTTESFAQSNEATADRWIVLAGRLTAGLGTQTAAVFVDAAAPDATIAVSVPATSMCGALVIGAERTGGSEYYAGDLARVLIYGRALTDAELAQTGRALGERYGIATQF